MYTYRYVEGHVYEYSEHVTEDVFHNTTPIIPNAGYAIVRALTQAVETGEFCVQGLDARWDSEHREWLIGPGGYRASTAGRAMQIMMSDSDRKRLGAGPLTASIYEG